jgi:hypothetical protein
VYSLMRSHSLIEASWTNARSLAASLSYRVATRRQCFILLNGTHIPLGHSRPARGRHEKRVKFDEDAMCTGWRLGKRKAGCVGLVYKLAVSSSVACEMGGKHGYPDAQNCGVAFADRHVV